MKVKLKGRKGTFTATKAIIHQWSTDVYIEELGHSVNDVEIVSRQYHREWDDAIEFFDNNHENFYGIFMKDYY